MTRPRKPVITLCGTSHDKRWHGETEADRSWLRTYFGVSVIEHINMHYTTQRLGNLGFQVIIRDARPGEVFS